MSIAGGKVATKGLKNRSLSRGAGGAGTTDGGIMPIQAISDGAGSRGWPAGEVMEGGNGVRIRGRPEEVRDERARLGSYVEHGGVNGMGGWGSGGVNHRV